MGEPWYEREIEELKKANADLQDDLFFLKDEQRKYKKINEERSDKIVELRAEVECEERRFAVLQEQLSDVARERDELRAQLARATGAMALALDHCVANFGTDHEFYHCHTYQNGVVPEWVVVVKELLLYNKTAALDAEMLNLANDMVKAEYYLKNRIYQKLERLFRARKEL